MVRIVDDEKLKAVVVIDKNGQEQILRCYHKASRAMNFFPGEGGPTIEKLVDIDTGGKGAKTKVVGYQLGLSSSTSGPFCEKFMDSAPEIQEAFVKAGFEKPEIFTPASTQMMRFARDRLRCVFR